MKKHGNIKLQKSVMVLILSALIVFGALAAGVIAYRIYQAKIAATLNKANITWYSEEEETFTISTVKELYDLAILSDFYDFKGQTIILDADLVVNEGNAEEWDEKAPDRQWFPIQKFAGTFDGQGHTISGLYGAGVGNSMGMFSDTNSVCKIRNFRLVNSYFSSNGTQSVGAIASNGSGLFEQIYTDAIVSTNRYYAGGIVGRVDSGKESSILALVTKISNCWFDGEVRLTSGAARMAGGIIGGIKIGNVRVEHCLSSGAVNCSNEEEAYSAGGFIGSVGVYKGKNNNIALNMEDCLHSGKVNTSYKTSVGSFIGLVYAGTNVKVAKSYTLKSELNSTDSVSGSMTGDALAFNPDWFLGIEAYRWTELDFNQYWSAVDEKTPELKIFSTEKALDLNGVTKAFDTDWYDEEAKDYIIDSVEDLYGLSMLCNQNVTFEGKMLKLAKDIVINDGKATDWEQGIDIPTLEWLPIGGGANKHRPFSGTFDGQGHTISGIYLKSSDYYLGFFGVLNKDGKSTIKNFKLTNSYFECTRTENLASEVDGLGSIAGQGAGILDTVYSDAIIVSGTRNSGGLIGNQRQKDSTLKINNCWFDGRVTGTQWIGGIVGFVYNGVKFTEITDCLVTADLTSTMQKDTDASYVGGLAGRIANAKISSCLTTGTYTGKKVVYSIIGRNTTREGQSILIEKCYSTADTKAMYENGSGGKTIAITSIRLKNEELQGKNGFENTLLNFYIKGDNEDGKWVAVNGEIPQLKSFAKGKQLDLSGAPRRYTNYDISWYDSAKDTYAIETAAQLYGVAAINNGDIGDVFRGKTIKLVKDITVNTGSAADWAKGVKLPTYTWTPIGGGEQSDNHRPFRGTFDGQGHTISGIYHKSDGYYIGLFGVMASDGTATVKNLELVNSYIECTRTDALSSELEGVGSIVGQGAGTLDTIYTNAILKNATRNTGGLVGNLRQNDAFLNVTNCWYNGEITGTQWIGGLLGFVSSGTKSIDIEDCLVTANLTSTTDQKHSYIGGVTARASAGTIDSCIVIGTLNGPGLVRSIVGMSATKDTQDLEISHCYNVSNADEFYNNALKQPVLTHVKKFAGEEIKGSKGYVNTLLDYYDKKENPTGRWALVDNQYPELKSFVKGNYVAELGVLHSLVRPIVSDDSWYKEAANELVISTAGQLYDFAERVNAGNKFTGKTIKLIADIKVNDGKATDWAKGENIPNNTWVPIGGGSNDGTKYFAGTFDGQGHIISGLYLKSNGNYLGLFGVLASDGTAEIKNLILTNTYFENTGTGTGTSIGLGSIAGQGQGKLKNIYSDAILKSTAYNTGGLVGSHRYATLTIKNSSYQGTATGAAYVGGILGYGYSAVEKTELQNCLVKADLGGTGNGVGGIVGGAYTANVESSLYVGALNTSGYKAGILGRVYTATGKAIQINKCYFSTEKDYVYTGTTTNPLIKNVTHFSDVKDLYGANAYTNTLLDFYDKNTNKDAKWVLVENAVPELRTFASKKYIEDLSAYGDLVRPAAPDGQWYDENATELFIGTVGHLYDFAERVNAGNTFAGKTIKLTTNLKLNEGNAFDWAEGKNLPKNIWTPIGKDTNNYFAGTFNGQGHTISGLYTKSNANYVGLFGVLDPDGRSTIMNLFLVNSYIECTNSAIDEPYGTGSIAGHATGVLDTIYSDAIVVTASKNAGGLVGTQFKKSIALSITNCMFTGSVKGLQFVGGIIGFVDDNTGATYVKDCYVDAILTATLSSGNACVGGLTGKAVSGIYSSCVVKGTFSGADAVTSFVGRSYQGKAVLTNCYDLTTCQNFFTAPSASQNPQVSTVKKVTESELTGVNAYTNTWLDFYKKEINEEGRWVAVKNGLLTLKSFAGNSQLENIEGLTRTVVADTSWYDASKASFTISTPNELYGLAKLCNSGTNFKEKTIYLSNDIVVNEGKSTDWANNQNIPKNVWTPIGGGSNNANRMFAGTFDGQGYTISGLYMKSNGNYLGLFGLLSSDGSSTVKNLRLVNTYFENTGTGTGTSIGLGSIAGQGQGKLENIYSDAILKSTAYNTGGLIGSHRYVKLMIDNCTYQGKITGTSYVGGILGFGYSAVDVAEISNCLVQSELVGSGNGIGGIIGGTYSAKVSSCIVIATLTTSGYKGGIVGRAYSATGKTIEVDKCYYYTNKSDAYTGASVSVTNSMHFTNVEQLEGMNAYENTMLDFYDVNANANAKWVLIENKTPELRTLTKEEYIKELSNINVQKRTTAVNKQEEDNKDENS